MLTKWLKLRLGFVQIKIGFSKKNNKQCKIEDWSKGDGLWQVF